MQIQESLMEPNKDAHSVPSILKVRNRSKCHEIRTYTIKTTARTKAS